MSYPKIIWPWQPDPPAAPALSQISGGALPARTEYYRLTFVLLDSSESYAGPEASIALSANMLAVVTSPSAPASPEVATAYNVYGSSTSGGETKQNASPIPLGTNWTEPTGGLISGSAMPSTYGTTLAFQWPPRNVPAKNYESAGSATISAAGVKQCVTLRIDEFLSLDMPFLALGTDATAWADFMFNCALLGVPFDYYPDASLSAYTTWMLEDTTFLEAYRCPGMVNFSMKWRKLVRG